MKTSLFAALTAALITFAAFATPAWAGDCQSVRFRFLNDTGKEIRVLDIRLQGNDGTWTENIGNERMQPDTYHTTNRRRLQHLDSGAFGNFRLYYDRRDRNGRWYEVYQDFNARRCYDGKMFTWRVTNT